MTLRLGKPAVLRHEHRDVTAVALASKQTLIATGGIVGKISLWESSEGVELMVLSGAHEADCRINTLAFNSDGSVLASGGEDARIILWDLADLGAKIRFRTLEGHGSLVPIMALSFSVSTSLLCSGGKDGDVMLWGNLGRPVCGRLRGHRSWVACCDFSSDGSFVATGGYDHAVCLWNTTTFTIVATL